MWDGDLNDIIATRCKRPSSSEFWFLNKQAFMTHGFIVVMELRFPPVETQINNQAPPSPHSCRTLLHYRFVLGKLLWGGCVVHIGLKGKSEMFILF